VPRPVADRTCSCGRVCASRSGMVTHGRSCSVEVARSAAYVAAIEAGLSSDALALHCRRTVDAVQAGRPAPVCPRPVYGRCHCGRPIRRRGSIECAEHDDPPPLD
jgi:hypothetical protein